MVQVYTRVKHNNNQESGSQINILCCRRFLRVLIFAVSPAICANKFLQTFFPQKLTPESISSNLNSLHKNTGLTNHVCSITTCLFHSETTKYWFIAWKYVFLLQVLNKDKDNYNQCWVWGIFWKSQKLISSKKNQSVLMAKISSHKTQRIANQDTRDGKTQYI